MCGAASCYAFSPESRLKFYEAPAPFQYTYSIAFTACPKFEGSKIM
jgi:hypothetical protein